MKKYGWIIVRLYNFLGEKYRPVGHVFPDGSYTGYIYVYPTRDCARVTLHKLKDDFSHFKIKRVLVEVID